MARISRTTKSIKNAQIALTFYFLNLILQFFSRKIFLDYLGSEVLGLNTTAQNLLGFLNIAELGIGTAVAYNLYKPLYDDNRKAINDIVSIQGWLYRRIAYIVIGGSAILMCFFPIIFAKAQVPLWYTYGSFIALLASALLGYFVNYKQIVLSADQKEYKITLCIQGVKFIKVLIQIFVIWLLDNGYLYWIITEIIMACVTSLVLNKIITKEYPWLHTTVKQGKSLQKQYPSIISKTKQVFYHQIASFVLTQTSPLIIYAYASLSLVAIYGNYLLIISGVSQLINALLNSVNAGVGNLVAEGNKQHIKDIYWEITTLRMWIAATICFGIYMLSHPFIKLWVGEEFILPQTAFYILIVNTFIGMTRTNDTFLAAYGLYQDVWAPIAEAFLNLGFSVLLGYFYGLTGILLGVTISLLIIVCSWKPYFLYKVGFKEPIQDYLTHYFKYLLVMLIPFYIVKKISNNFNLEDNLDKSFIEWGVFGFIIIMVYAIICLVLLSSTDKSARAFCRRIYNSLIKQ